MRGIYQQKTLDSEYYYVMLKVEFADETQAVKHLVVKGNELRILLACYFRVVNGECYDTFHGDEIAEFNPISKEEAAKLSKDTLKHMSCGKWWFDDIDDYDHILSEEEYALYDEGCEWRDYFS